jgi:hypothetical protein
MYNIGKDHWHHAQVDSLRRKNQLLTIIDEHPGIFRKKMIALCWVNYGWNKRTTKEYIDLLMDLDILVKDEEERLYTHAHVRNPERHA